MSRLNIRFTSAEHRDFFLRMMSEARKNDCYHQSFFYVMGIAPETRANIRQMFDFKQDCIKPEGMHGEMCIRDRPMALRLGACPGGLACSADCAFDFQGPF